MNRVFAGEVYDIIPQANGIVFAYKKGNVNENVVVGYKMLSFESGCLTDVAKNIYLLSKYGSNYRIAEAICDNYITAKSIIMPSGKVFICRSDGEADIIDSNGETVWTGEMKYKTFAPSGIAAYKNGIWASFSESGVLIRFNVNTMREELRVGGKTSPFKKPHGIFIEGENAIVSNKETKTLLSVNLNSYTVKEIEEFSEAVYGYARVKDYQFVLLESGVYVL